MESQISLSPAKRSILRFPLLRILIALLFVSVAIGLAQALTLVNHSTGFLLLVEGNAAGWFMGGDSL